MSKPQFQYVTELHDHDVVLGRGSGPNDRPGNINFRSLCNERKIAYIEATSRDEKGRIAADIVATVHGRGGRFLKRLSAEEAKKVEFQRGEAVYELADEQTILEKTKQTLRQNRAVFVAKVEKEVGRAPVVGAYPIRNGDDKKGEAVKSIDDGGTADNHIMNNIDPIPLGESYGLDSNNHPVVSINSAETLLAALLGASDNTLQSNENPRDTRLGPTQSGNSALSIEEMSGLLYDALHQRSNGGMEADSAKLFQSILNECSANEYMAEQLVSALLKDSKSEQNTFSLTGPQKALLLRYEQMQDHEQMHEQQQQQQQQQQQAHHQMQQQQQQQRQQARQHPFGQYQLNETANSANFDFAPGSVFSSLLRHYNDFDDPDQLSDLQQDLFANSSPTAGRRVAHRTTVAGRELLNIEPANFMDESMDISFKAARELNKALGGGSMSTLGIGTPANSRELSWSSSKTRSRRRGGSLDSSILSLMSMSISEITPHPGGPLKPTREGSTGTPDEVKIKDTNEVWNSLRTSDLIVDIEEDFPF